MSKMTESAKANQLRVPKRLLAEWANKPDNLGAWVDLALEDAETEKPPSWTEAELGRRWGSRWDPEKVRAWLEEAVALELVEPAGEAERWRLRRREIPKALDRRARIANSNSEGAHDEVRRDRADISFDLQELLSIEELERAYVFFVLESCSDNKVRAANVLQIDPSTLHRKLRRWDRRS